MRKHLQVPPDAFLFEEAAELTLDTRPRSLGVMTRPQSSTEGENINVVVNPQEVKRRRIWEVFILYWKERACSSMMVAHTNVLEPLGV